MKSAGVNYIRLINACAVVINRAFASECHWRIAKSEQEKRSCLRKASNDDGAILQLDVCIVSVAVLRTFQEKKELQIWDFIFWACFCCSSPWHVPHKAAAFERGVLFWMISEMHWITSGRQSRILWRSESTPCSHIQLSNPKRQSQSWSRTGVEWHQNLDKS